LNQTDAIFNLECDLPVGYAMDNLVVAELITLASGLIGVAMPALGFEDRAAKEGLDIVNSNLKAV